MRQSPLFCRLAAPLALLLVACSGPGESADAPDADAPGPVDAIGDGSGAALDATSPQDVTPSPEVTPAPDVPPTQDATPRSDTPAPCADGGCFGAPCDTGDDCFSGLCADHMGNSVCTKACDEDCPAGGLCSDGHVCINPGCRTNADCAGGDPRTPACAVEKGESVGMCSFACDKSHPCPEPNMTCTTHGACLVPSTGPSPLTMCKTTSDCGRLGSGMCCVKGLCAYRPEGC